MGEPIPYRTTGMFRALRRGCRLSNNTGMARVARGDDRMKRVARLIRADLRPAARPVWAGSLWLDAGFSEDALGVLAVGDDETGELVEFHPAWLDRAIDK